MGRTPYSGGPIEIGMRKKLVENLNPTYLEIINESHNHSTPPEAETHFKLVVVAKQFQDMPLIKVCNNSSFKHPESIIIIVNLNRA